MDNDFIDNRIKELKSNLAAGQEQLRTLDERKRELENTMLRISGAIQVLEELKAEQAAEAAKDAGTQ